MSRPTRDRQALAEIINRATHKPSENIPAKPSIFGAGMPSVDLPMFARGREALVPTSSARVQPARSLAVIRWQADEFHQQPR